MKENERGQERARERNSKWSHLHLASGRGYTMMLKVLPTEIGLTESGIIRKVFLQRGKENQLMLRVLYL
jgi:hypothetical protein